MIGRVVTSKRREELGGVFSVNKIVDGLSIVGNGFCVVGTRIVREFRVSNSAWSWKLLLAWGCGDGVEEWIWVLGAGVLGRAILGARGR